MTRVAVAALTLLLLGGPAGAATFVYVSNAEDGTIGAFTMRLDGTLDAIGTVTAQTLIMPLAVSQDKHYLVGAARSKPYSAYTYRIDKVSGKLEPLGKSPLYESVPYISFDRTGNFLFGASYGGNLVTVNAVHDGKVGETVQVVPTARFPHSIRPDSTNRFVYVPQLGSDQIFQFSFDQKAGRLTSSTPPLVQMPPNTGPRHFVTSTDNRFMFLLNELNATVTTLEIDAKTGLLKPLGSSAMLPANTTLRPGLPRGAVGAPGSSEAPRNIEDDIWAADLHLTPDGRFLFASERTSSTIGMFRIDAGNGTTTYLGNFATEKQPRGFAIEPSGKFMVVSGEKSDKLAVYALSGDDRLPTLQGRYPTGQGANWVEIVSPE